MWMCCQGWESVNQLYLQKIYQNKPLLKEIKPDVIVENLLIKW